MDAIDQLLGITAVVGEAVASSPTASPTATVEEVVDADKPTEEKELEDDFQYARKGIKEMVDVARTALDSAVVLAQAGDSPRAYEVVGKLLENIVNAKKELVELHQKKKDTLTKPTSNQPLLPTVAGGSVTIERAVFIGRASDLLREIKQIEKNSTAAEAAAEPPSDAHLPLLNETVHAS